MHLIHALVAPPANLLLLALCGALLWKRRPRLARTLVVAAFALLWIVATPWVGAALLRSLQVDAPLVAGEPWPQAGAVVVLAAGTRRTAPEFGGATVDALTLERVRYGAQVHRLTGAPLLVTGGPVDDDVPSVAQLMRDVLESEFGVTVRWVEGEAQSTWENATNTAELLRAADVRRIYLVTHAWHMPRARAAFEATGLEVVPAPTAFRRPQGLTLGALLPTAKGLGDSSFAFHEWVGRLWYELAKH